MLDQSNGIRLVFLLPFTAEDFCQSFDIGQVNNSQKREDRKVYQETWMLIFWFKRFKSGEGELFTWRYLVSTWKDGFESSDERWYQKFGEASGKRCSS